jgi:DNA anti-recombination protein RmuC
MSDIPSPSCSIYTPSNSNVINNGYHALLTHFQDMIRVISDRAKIVYNDQQRLDGEVRHSQASLQIVTKNLLLIKESFEDIVSRDRGLKTIEDLRAQQIWSLKQDVADALSTSYDGKYIWKITGVREKLGMH